MGLNWWKAIRDNFIESKTDRDYAKPLSRAELASYDPPWNGLLWYMGESLGWIGWICQNWYTGGRPTIMMDLMTGSRNPTITGLDNAASWELAEMIHRSPELKSLFKKYPDERFFHFLEQCVDGPACRTKYEEHVRLRGHPDRDVYFDRRADSPMVDLRLFPALMGTPEPRKQEELMRDKLEASIQRVYDNLMTQPMGVFKAKLFQFLIDFSHHSLEYRDNKREVMDWSTDAIKLGFEEIGRRCVARGGLREMKERCFLTMEEPYAVLRGKTTSVARVVHELSQIGRVKQGEILIVHATDPGWTPVFMLIKGIVLETGGLISHDALLAREYGLPGVQIPSALTLVPDTLR